MTIVQAYKKALDFYESKLKKLGKNAHLAVISPYDAYRNIFYQYSLVKFHLEYILEGEANSTTLDLNVYCLDTRECNITVEER